MNILHIFEQFPTQASCIEYLEKIRWGDEIRCPYCNATNTAKAKHRHRCYTCKTSFSVTVGTIFHNTHLPLQKWFLAIMLMLNDKKGIAALQLSRDLKVNKNTAGRMKMQIRKAMTQIEHRSILQSIVEMDDTYIGVKPGRGTGKAPVIGDVQREGDVAGKAVNSKKMMGHNMRAFVRQRVHTEKSGLYTVECKAYTGMSKVVSHYVIRHQDWYVEGDIHTNTIESFWTLLTRGMFGPFHSVSQQLVQRYVDEFCYRYNLRKANSQFTFNLTLNRALGVTI